MRGDDQQLQTGMFSYVALEDRIPADHPLRGVRKLVDAVLVEMSKDLDGLYSQVGRPSIAPERLLRALLLQVFYSVRSERLLMEQLNYNLLFRWFVGLEIDDAVWNHAVFSKNRDRLLNQDLAQKFFAHVKEQAAGLMSDEHFTVDGTLIEAWAGQKSFRRKDEDQTGSGGGGDFHGEPRSNQTHASSTDPEARLYKKSAGQEAKLSYLGHTLVENRNGLIAAAMTTQADGRAERDAALLMLHELTRKRNGRITAGADKAYDTRDFVDTVRELGVTPHVARRQHGAIDERTSRHPGYAISLSKRWLVEKPFGWLKQIGPLKKVKLRGLAKVDWLFVFSCAAFNLIRIPKLRAQSA
jgi:transposase